MRLSKRIEPKQFNFKPRFYKPIAEESDKGIKFTRKTLYDPHTLVRGQWTYISIAVVIVIIIFILGGIRPRVTTPKLTVEDVAVNHNASINESMSK